MKTIAITIDDETLQKVDGVVAGGPGEWKSRSELARRALQQFLAEVQRREDEDRERRVLRRHRDRLRRQAAALVQEQARP